MPRLLLLLVFLQLSFCLFGQATFKKRFGTSNNDQAQYVEALPDNSFLVAGSSQGGGLGLLDAILVKLSAAGSVEWSKAYGGSGMDLFVNILPCSDGNFIALGETTSFGAGSFDIYVVKFDINGNVLWERTCGGANQETARGICEVSDGYIVTGATQSFGNGFWDIFVEKLDLNGNSVWSKAWGTNGPDFAGDPLPAANGEIWVSGYLFIGTNNSDAVLMRLSAGGTLLNINRIGGAGNDYFYRLVSGGPGLVCSGTTTTYGNNQSQPSMVGLTVSGDLIWAKRYLLPSGNYEIKAINCPDGGFVFTPIAPFGGVSNAYLVKTDGSGNITWANSYPLGGTGGMQYACPTPDGGYVAVGYTSGAGQEMFILKTDAAGRIEDCCPTDAPITAEIITPPMLSSAPNGADGPAAGSPAGQNQTVGLDEIDLCNGPSCCPTNAGTMLAQTLHACISLPATFTHNGDEVLDGNDLLRFILFSDLNDTLGSIIAISNTPTFTFNPATMQTGVTYYVAAIAGNNVGGNVDFDDPCFDISNAAELIWHPLPGVTFSANTTDVCAGGCRVIDVVLTGTPPFTLTVSSPAGTATFTFSGNTGSFEICPPAGSPPGSFSVEATMLTNTYCTCQ